MSFTSSIMSVCTYYSNIIVPSTTLNDTSIFPIYIAWTKLYHSTLQTFQPHNRRTEWFSFCACNWWNRSEGTIRTHNNVQLKCGVVGKLNTNKSNYVFEDRLEIALVNDVFCPSTPPIQCVDIYSKVCGHVTSSNQYRLTNDAYWKEKIIYSF